MSAYQSMPVSRVDAGPNAERKFTRVNTASIDFYLSNPSIPSGKRKAKEEEKKDRGAIEA